MATISFSNMPLYTQLHTPCCVVALLLRAAPPPAPPRVDVLAPDLDQARETSQRSAPELQRQRHVVRHRTRVLGGGGGGGIGGGGGEDATPLVILALLAFAGVEPRVTLRCRLTDEVEGGLPHDVVVG